MSIINREHPDPRKATDEKKKKKLQVCHKKNKLHSSPKIRRYSFSGSFLHWTLDSDEPKDEFGFTEKGILDKRNHKTQDSILIHR